MMGIRVKYFVIIMLGASFGVLSLNTDDAFSETMQWESKFTAGILKTEPSEFGIYLIVSTFDKNAIKLEWQEPDTDKKIIGYEILRKTLDTEYITHVENTNSLETSFVDENLEKGYYGYKVIPVTQKPDPQIISKHGIDRNHPLFDAYMMGQQLLAEFLLQKNCPTCFEEHFSESTRYIVK
jgi:hypothetical protein